MTAPSVRVALDEHLRRVQILADAGRLEEAVAELSAAAPELGGEALFHYALGGLLLRLGDPDRAVRTLEEAVRLAPDVAEMHASLGGALVERAAAAGRPEEMRRALAELEEALALDNRLASAHNNLGMALQRSGRLPEALAAFDVAITTGGGNGARYNRAATLHLLGREPEALVELEGILHDAPDFVPALRSRCATFARLSRFDKARAALAAYERAAPGAADIAELRRLCTGS
jgi:tetratricopeptide (TPR) repeat protein